MLNIEPLTLESTLTHLDLPAVTLTLTHPVVAADDSAARRINAFYARLAAVIAKHARRVLLPNAARALDTALAASRAFEPWRVKLSFTAEAERDARDDSSDAPDDADCAETLVITHTLYVRLGGEERERCFATVWEVRSGLILRTRDFAPTY